jgi:MFS family permease
MFLSHRNVVQERGSSEEILVLLLVHHSCWRFWWINRGRHRQDGWCWRVPKLEMGKQIPTLQLPKHPADCDDQLFILEGAFTVLMALVVFFFLSDFPEEAKWLKPDEKAFVTARLRVDQGDAARESKVTLKKVGGILSEFRVFIAGVMYFGLIVPAYSYAYFSPAIIKSFGYTPIQTQLHSVPPWAAAFGWSMIMATFSDLSRHRFSFIIFGICIAITAFAILISVHDNIQVQYAALFLAAMGCYSTMPFMVCWFNMNIGSHARRSVCSAWQVGFGNIGGIIAVFAFFPADAPTYKTGYSICIAFTILAMVATVLYGWSCISTNRKRDKMPTDLNLSEQDKADLGDHSPEYRFLL